MSFGNRRAIFGVVFLVPALLLIGWSVSAPPARCALAQNLGYVFLAKGTLATPRAQLGTAERWFSNPLLAGCRPESATYGLGQSYSGLGQLSPAIAALNAGGERVDLRHFLIGRLYDALGQPEDAWREYAKLPRDAAATFYRLGDRAEKSGDYDKAVHYFSVATLINPAYPKAYYAAALVYWRRLGDQDKAGEMVRQALAVDPRPSLDRDFFQGLLCYYRGNNDCALTAWVSAVRHSSANDTDATPRYLAYAMLSRVMYEHGRFAFGHLARAEAGH